MKIIDPKTTPTPALHQILVGAVAPRPIAFVSTIDKDGNPNLAPYSFFNVFSSNPPTLVFSSNRRVSDNTTKDTLQNVEATREVVVNAVSYSIVRQMAVASIQYPPGVDEFEKSGLTPLKSDLVKPFRVAESPVQMECKVKDIITLGEEGGAGHLVICEIVRIHLDESILDEEGRINPHKLDLMGRMGRAFYVRASGEAIHKIFQPLQQIGIGYDQLPASVRNSTTLTGNNLGQLSSLTAPPDPDKVDALKEDTYVKTLIGKENAIEELHLYVQKELAKENLELAAQLAWLGEKI
jgi:flavin reductase (DIM6/NTAB) family NADH-FMN oxidoreductase RutF